MNTAQDIKDFVSQKTLAMIGVSRNPGAFSSMVFRDLRKKGYKVIPVNPQAASIDNEVCYPSIGKIPVKAGGVLIFTPPKETEKVVREVHEAAIAHIWIQQGAESDEAVAFCRENNLKAVSGQCIYMFAEPVPMLHAIHKWFAGLFGKIPR